MTFAETLVAGVVVALVSASATVWLSLRRFHNEKLWERKLESYTAILEALIDLEIQTREVYREYVLLRDVSNERVVQLEARAQAARDQLRRAVARATFVIAADASDAVSQVLIQIEAAEDAESRSDYITQRSTAIASCVAAIRTIATRDLK